MGRQSDKYCMKTKTIEIKDVLILDLYTCSLSFEFYTIVYKFFQLNWLLHEHNLNNPAELIQFRIILFVYVYKHKIGDQYGYTEDVFNFSYFPS